MRVEAGGLPELGNGRSAVREAGARRRRRGRRTRAPPAMAAPAAVQRLFEACREVFSGARGAVPPPAGVERIKSVLDCGQLSQGHRLAKVKAGGILSAPCETSVLYPEDGGNKHCFTAQSACAVLDVLGPPYDDGSVRHCQHYNVSSSAPSVGDSRSLSGCDGYAWLEEIEPPEDFYLVGSTYMGPKILDH